MDKATIIIYMIGGVLWMRLGVIAFLDAYEKYKFCNDKTILCDKFFIPLAKGFVIGSFVCLLVYFITHYCPFFVKMREYV